MKSCVKVTIKRDGTMCVVCGRGIASGVDAVRMFPPTQLGGVNAHCECYAKGHDFRAWRERGRCGWAKTQNGVNVDDSDNTVRGAWYTLKFETTDRTTADYMALNGFTTWTVGKVYNGQMRRNNAQQLTRLAKKMFKEHDFTKCTVNGIECNCTDDVHNAINQVVQNQVENISK